MVQVELEAGGLLQSQLPQGMLASVGRVAQTKSRGKYFEWILHSYSPVS